MHNGHAQAITVHAHPEGVHAFYTVFWRVRHPLVPLRVGTRVAQRVRLPKHMFLHADKQV